MTAREWCEAFYAQLKAANMGENPVRFQVEELVEKAMKDQKERDAKIANEHYEACGGSPCGQVIAEMILEG